MIQRIFCDELPHSVGHGSGDPVFEKGSFMCWDLAIVCFCCVWTMCSLLEGALATRSNLMLPHWPAAAVLLISNRDQGKLCPAIFLTIDLVYLCPSIFCHGTRSSKHVQSPDFFGLRHLCSALLHTLSPSLRARSFLFHTTFPLFAATATLT
ncbi:hypothetical protein B0J18DRAFT_47282 [Chaetomium sp. MPI-SDFR-AT-0129]|nr:hypothetical protein B0J18DRAFT_47282 [Chaetomium sp. MPI-SDFR-AT-0129]